MGSNKFRKKPVSDENAVCLFLFGLIVFGFGIYYLTRSQFAFREESVRQYDDAAAEWDSQWYDGFEGSTFKVKVGDLSGSGYTILSANTTIDYLVDDGEDVEEYKKLAYYGLPLSNHTDTYKWNTSEMLFEFNMKIKDGEETKDSLSLPLMTQSIHHANRKMCIQGSYSLWIDNKCYKFEVLRTVCVQVIPDNNTWKFDKTNGGMCHGETNDDSSEREYQGYRHIAGLSHKKSFEIPEQNFTNLEVVVRHYKDPYLTALALTGNSMDFGISQKASFSLGFILICVSCLMFVIPIWSICVYCEKKGRKFREEEEFRETASNYPINHTSYPQERDEQDEDESSDTTDNEQDDPNVNSIEIELTDVLANDDDDLFTNLDR